MLQILGAENIGLIKLVYLPRVRQQARQMETVEIENTVALLKYKFKQGEKPWKCRNKQKTSSALEGVHGSGLVHLDLLARLSLVAILYRRAAPGQVNLY